MRSSQIDFRAKLWTCPFCGQRNHFPPEYAQNISESSLPYEVMPAYTTVEYEIQGRQSIPPVFLLIIDTTIDVKELNSLKDALQQNLSFLPDNALVGIISYGMHVEVHELTTSDISRSYVFNGKKEYPTSKVADMLGLRGTVAQTQVRIARLFLNLDRRLFLRLPLHHAHRRLLRDDRHHPRRAGEGPRTSPIPLSPLVAHRRPAPRRALHRQRALHRLLPAGDRLSAVARAHHALLRRPVHERSGHDRGHRPGGDDPRARGY